jgi:hypothetical protein
LYFGNQCPNNGYLLARIKTLAWKEFVPLHLHDVTDDERICKEYRLFSPQLLIVNDRYRVLGSFSKEQVLALLEDELQETSRSEPPNGDDIVRGTLIPIDSESALSTCRPCTGTDDAGLCMGKSEWVRETLKKTGTEHLGYLHIVDGACVGGAEFLPSRMVPYPIPDKGDGDAFLTCVFRTDRVFDFRTHPLERLIEELGRVGFSTVSVVASDSTLMPNGPAAWFEKKGFEDRGVIGTEEMVGAEMHYLRMVL